MEAGALTSVLIHFSAIFAQSVKNLTPYAVSIFSAVIVIDFAWALSLILLDPSQPAVSTAIRKAVRYGMFYWLIQNYSDVVSGLLKTFTTVGLAAGGNLLEPSVITDPSYVIDLGFATWHPILKSIGLVNMLASHRPIMALLTYIFAVIGYFVIAMQIFVTYLEFYVIAGLAVYFLPFGCWERTAFLSEKAIGAIIAVSVRILVVAFVLSASLPALIELQTASSGWIEGADNTQATKCMFTVLAIAFLSWMVPSLATGLFSGTPSLSGGQAIAGGMMTAAMITRALTGGFASLRNALQAGGAAGAASTLATAMAGSAGGGGGGAGSDIANTARIANLAAASGSGGSGGGFSTVGGDAGYTVSASDLGPAEIAAGVSGGSGQDSAAPGSGKSSSASIVGASSVSAVESVSAGDLNSAEIAAGVSGGSSQGSTAASTGNGAPGISGATAAQSMAAPVQFSAPDYAGTDPISAAGASKPEQEKNRQ